MEIFFPYPDLRICVARDGSILRFVDFSESPLSFETTCAIPSGAIVCVREAEREEVFLAVGGTSGSPGMLFRLQAMKTIPSLSMVDSFDLAGDFGGDAKLVVSQNKVHIQSNVSSRRSGFSFHGFDEGRLRTVWVFTENAAALALYENQNGVPVRFRTRLGSTKFLLLPLGSRVEFTAAKDRLLGSVLDGTGVVLIELNLGGAPMSARDLWEFKANRGETFFAAFPAPAGTWESLDRDGVVVASVQFDEGKFPRVFLKTICDERLIAETFLWVDSGRFPTDQPVGRFSLDRRHIVVVGRDQPPQIIQAFNP